MDAKHFFRWCGRRIGKMGWEQNALCPGSTAKILNFTLTLNASDKIIMALRVKFLLMWSHSLGIRNWKVGAPEYPKPPDNFWILLLCLAACGFSGGVRGLVSLLNPEGHVLSPGKWRPTCKQKQNPNSSVKKEDGLTNSQPRERQTLWRHLEVEKNLETSPSSVTWTSLLRDGCNISQALCTLMPEKCNNQVCRCEISSGGRPICCDH